VVSVGWATPWALGRQLLEQAARNRSSPPRANRTGFAGGVALGRRHGDLRGLLFAAAGKLLVPMRGDLRLGLRRGRRH
jgi:hypothetical protein